MMKKSTREVFFFVLVLLMFFVVVRLYEFWMLHTQLNKEVMLALVSLLFTGIIVAVFFLAKLQSNTENFWDVSEYAKCKGGPYFWQGDSEQAKKCRALAETPEGRCGLASYNCPTGFVGTPNLPFEYTPISGDDWSNERCDDKPKCSCPFDQTSLSSFTKNVLN